MRYLVGGIVDRFHTFFNCNGFRDTVVILRNVTIDGAEINTKIQMPVGKWCAGLIPGNKITFRASLDLSSSVLQPKRPHLQSKML